VDDAERRFVEAVETLRGMYVEARGESHPWLDGLLSSATRRSPMTLNWLVATASGTLLDAYFCSENGDRKTAGRVRLVQRAVECATG
jgi:hypothetical protein